MSIEKKQKQLIKKFSMLENWEDKYKYLIFLGKTLPLFNMDLKTDDRLIKGCQSKVWIESYYDNHKLFFKADSDGILSKGLAAILINIFSGELANDIIHSSMDFIEKIGFQEFLSPSRANGMLAMIKKIKFLAIVYKFKNEK